MGTATDAIYTPQEIADLLERSNERDLYDARILAAWHEGHAAAELAHADDYERGLYDGAMCRKRAEHDLVDMARLDVARWGPLGREHYADPRPGDYDGGPVTWKEDSGA